MIVAGWCGEVEQSTMYECSMNRLDYSMRGLVSHNGATIFLQFKLLQSKMGQTFVWIARFLLFLFKFESAAYSSLWNRRFDLIVGKLKVS